MDHSSAAGNKIESMVKIGQNKRKCGKFYA